MAVGIDVDAAVQGPQQLIAGGAVEAFQGAVPLGVLGLAVDEPGPQSALHHGKRVVGDEAGAPVQIHQVWQPMLGDHAVEPVQE
ncbi:hypothetical protein ES703_49835 [subsurface metagenome]